MMRGAAGRCTTLCLILALCALAATGTAQRQPRPSAQQPAPVTPSRQALVVILCPGLTADDLDRPDLPNLRALAARGAVGLMNVAAPRRDPTTSLLTLAVGDHVAAVPTDGEVASAGAAGFDEGATAGVVFTRRTGLPAPEPDVLVHLGIASLARRNLNRELLGARLPAGSSWALAECAPHGALQPEGLLLVHADGLGPRVLRLQSQPRDSAGQTPANLLIPVRDPAGADAALAVLRHASWQPTIVLCPLPTPDWSIGGARLPAVVWASPTGRIGLLTSATTRTPGLVANIDLAPTILAHEGAAPEPGAAGHPWTVAAAADPIPQVRRLDHATATNQAALVPVFGVLGVVCALVAFTGLYCAAVGRSARAQRVAALVLFTMPLAMLLAAPLRCETVPALSAAIVAWMLVLGAVAWGMTRNRPTQGPALVMAATSVAILLDAVLNLRLVQFSMFSGYQIQGIRFYGIGNEYMGVLIGSALFTISSWPGPAVLRIALLAGALIVLGHPGLGAKAGGIIVGSAALGLGVALVRGRQPTWRALALWTAAGIAAAFSVAWLDRTASGDVGSHLGAALAAAQVRGASHLAEIVARKLSMNLRIATNPIMLGAAVLAAIALGVASRTPAFQNGPWSDQPARAAGFRAAGMAALVALLFNDSGAVAAIFIVGPFIMGYLHDLFALASAPGKEPASPTANDQPM